MSVLLSGSGKVTWWRRILVVLPIISIVLSCVFYFSTYDHWIIYSRYGIIFASNLVLMIGVYLVVGLKVFGKIDDTQ